MEHASSLGWASQPIRFPVDPAAHGRGGCAATQVPYFLLLNSQMGKHGKYSWELYWELYLLHMLRWTNKGLTFSSSSTNAWVFVFTHFFSASGIWLWYNWHTGNILFHCARFLMQLFLVKWTHTTLDSTPKKASENLLLHIWVCIVNGNVAYKNRAGNLMLENSQRANRLQEGISGWKKSSDFLTCQKIRTQPVSVSLIK